MTTQIMIDVAACSKADLLEAARYIIACAHMKDGSTPDFSALDASQPQSHSIPAAPVVVPAGTVAADPTPAEVFGGQHDAAPVPPAAVIPPPPPPPTPVTAMAPAPVATVTPSPVVSAPASSAVELDAAGLPWDARIHAETKAKNKTGEWRTKRGAKPDYVAAVTAELRVSYPAPTQSAPPAPAPVVVPPAPPANAGFVPPPPPVGTAPVLPSAGAQSMTFPTLMAKITAATNQQKLTRAQLDEALAAHKITAISLLITASPEVLTSINTYLGRWGI